MNTSADKIIEKQRDRFDEEAKLYDYFHMHPTAQKYRNNFIRQKLFDFNISGMKVLDAMCATGIDTPFFIERGAQVTGLDISSECADIFESRYDSKCVVGSMHDTGLDDDEFDIVFIGGGLHHIAHMIPECINEIRRILKPGGIFCALEPNHDDWSNKLRQVWYRLDGRFEDNERALSYHKEITPFTNENFKEEKFFRAGNIAYLLIQQASTLRTPRFVLNYLGSSLMILEKILTYIPGVPKLYWCFRWRKSKD